MRSERALPIDVVFHPNWWHSNFGFTFDRDYFVRPDRKVEQDRAMRRALFERFPDLGLGEEDPPPRPVVGPVLLATGYLIQAILGCEVRYADNASPWVIPANRSPSEIRSMQPPDDLTSVEPMAELIALMDTLENRFGYLEGDWGIHGVLDVALAVRGQEFFFDLYDDYPLVDHLCSVITATTAKVVAYIRRRTGSSGISSNRIVASIDPAIHVHGNCSTQMLSPKMYEERFLKFDAQLAGQIKPWGVHHCGNNAHLYAPLYARLGARYLDVGWGSDIRRVRECLPDAWLSLRLNPVRVLRGTVKEVQEDVSRLLGEHGSPAKVALVCINIDAGTPDENVRAIFETAAHYWLRLGEDAQHLRGDGRVLC